MVRSALAFVLLASLLPACDEGRPDAGLPDSGIPVRCSFAANPWRSAILELEADHPIPLLEVAPDSGFCLEDSRLALPRVDAPGEGAARWTEDGGLIIRAGVGGVYALTANGYLVFSDALYFAKRTTPARHWNQTCGEFRSLGGEYWACDGQLVKGDSVELDGASRWLVVPDAGIASAWPDGVHLASAAGADAGPLAFALPGATAWTAALDGLSVVNADGVYDCRLDTMRCELLLPGIGAPAPYPDLEEVLDAIVRRDGHTFFTRKPSLKPWCDANAHRCSTDVAFLIADDGTTLWQMSALVGFDGRAALAGMAWNGGAFEFTGSEFFTPPHFRPVAVQSGVLPSAVLLTDQRQLLVWRWYATGEAFHFVDLPGPLIAAGAEPGLFWYSTSGPDGGTFLHVDE